MKCPYCSNMMEDGYIPRDRYTLQWVSKNKTSILPFSNKRIKLHQPWGEPYVDAFYCSTCHKIIVNIGE